MIETKEHDYQRVILALGPLQLAVKSVFHDPAVVQSRQRITDGLGAESLSQKQAGERERNAPARGHGQPLLRFLQTFKSFGSPAALAEVVLDMQDTQSVAQCHQGYAEVP